MKKIIKFSLFGLAGVLLLVALLVGVIAATFNPNDYKPLIIKLVQEKKQRTLHIDGDIKLTFWPKIGADLGKISISEHKSEQEFAAVKGMKVSLAVMPLLQKQLVVDTIYVDGASANIVRYKDGSTNFDDLMSKEEDDDESQAIKFDVDGVNVADSSVSFKDEGANTTYSISQFNLKTGHVALKTPFDLATDFVAKASNPKVDAKIKVKGNFMADPEAKHFVVKGLDANINGDLATLNKADINLSGNVDAKPDNMELLLDSLKLAVSGNLSGAKLTADLAAPKLVVQKNEVSGKEATVNFNQENGSDTIKAKLILADIKGSPAKLQSSGMTGEVSIKQGARSVESKFSSPFSGNLEKLVFELSKLAGNIDVKDASLPNGGIKADFAFKILADVKQELINTDFNVAVDESKLKGQLGISHFAQPAINLNLDIDKLDADKYITKSSSKPASETKSDPNAPIDLSGLKAINAKGDLHVGWLKVANIKTTDVRVKFDANNGLINMPTLAAKLYDGSMNGSLKLDAQATPAIAFKQNMTSIAIGPLLTDAINNDMLSGKGTLNVDITTQGNTVGALKKALNGKAGVNLADGAVKGIDIAGTLRGVKDKLNVLKSESKVDGDKSKKTDFSEMIATFDIKNGVAHNDDLSMKAPLFRITGSGDIDIANETLNYVAKPTVVATLKGQGGGDLDSMNGLTIPVKLTGTFAKPSYAIDFASMGTALAQKKIMDSVSNIKGGDALKSLMGGKKTDSSTTTSPTQKPATPEDKAKQKLNKLLGL